jgi:type I restriction enzyme, S subunit
MDGEFNIEFWKGGKALLNQRVCRIIPKDSVADILFLKYRLSTLLKRIEDETPFVTVKHLSSEKLKEEVIELPPLTEQKRIASLLARADRLSQLRRTAHDLGDALLQSVFLEMFEEQLKPNYPITPMEELVKITGGGTPSRDVPEYFQGNIPWLTSKDMRGDYIYDTQEHITERAIRESATNLVPVGSILLVVKSKILMRHLPIAITKVPLCHGQDIKSIQCSKKVNLLFLVAVLKYNEAKILFQARGANTEGLTLPMLNEIKVPNVPLSLQEEFASVVARVEGLRGRTSEAGRQVEGLFESLLSESFGG